MSLAPLFSASAAIQFHAFAIAAFGLGVVQLAAPKATLPHRTIGWIWLALMVVVSGSAFSIHQIRVWGQWSAIHLLAIVTLTARPLAVWYGHSHNVRKHRAAMLSLFIDGLVIAGVFTLLPGRIIHAAILGR